MKFKFGLIIFSLFILAGCADDGVPVIGMDDGNEFVLRFAGPETFRDELHEVAQQVHESTFLALRNSPPDRSGHLRSVIVGLGFNLQGGLGDLITIGVSPKVRFAFSNSTRPIVP